MREEWERRQPGKLSDIVIYPRQGVLCAEQRRFEPVARQLNEGLSCSERLGSADRIKSRLQRVRQPTHTNRMWHQTQHMVASHVWLRNGIQLCASDRQRHTANIVTHTVHVASTCRTSTSLPRAPCCTRAGAKHCILLHTVADLPIREALVRERVRTCLRAICKEVCDLHY